ELERDAVRASELQIRNRIFDFGRKRHSARKAAPVEFREPRKSGTAALIDFARRVIGAKEIGLAVRITRNELRDPLRNARVSSERRVLRARQLETRAQRRKRQRRGACAEAV